MKRKAATPVKKPSKADKLADVDTEMAAIAECVRILVQLSDRQARDVVAYLSDRFNSY